ncbi:MAG: ribosomal-processing cysteine protease Prp [Acholeplasmatales bacterium]|jgi:uncharacterized protein YsxB (DUF464 family)|nr:ribosomal-processing cysteine protease Prp [Acholeplasmatales bacterium]
MIRFMFEEENGFVKIVKVWNHSENLNVCASVSTGITLSINIIESLDLKENIIYELKEGYFNLEILKNNSSLDKIIRSLIFMLNDLKESYPKQFK